MPTTLLKHGTNEGYKAELARDEKPCMRCQNAHRVYGRQYTKAGKKAGLKYGGHEVIDHLYAKPSPSRVQANPSRFPDPSRPAVGQPSSDPYVFTEPTESESAPAVSGPSWGDALADRIKGLRVGRADDSNPYVSEDTGEFDDFSVTLTPIDPDPDPENDQWEPAGPDQFLLNAAGLKLIEDNLGTYLSVVGITVEMIDPVCGPVLAENFDNIISHWTKVIARYPRAAKMFMSEDGGTIFAWIGAIQATWPVLWVIYQHHLARSIKRNPDGSLWNRRQTNADGSQMVDPLTPPMAGSNSGFAYTTG